MNTIVGFVIAAVALGGDDDDALMIVDEPPAARSAWSWSGRTLALVAGDVEHGDGRGGEHTLAALAELGLALGFEPSPRWEARARVRSRYTVEGRSGDVWQDVVPDVVEARVTWRPDDGPELSLGWLADLRWPELATPHPWDGSLGPLPPTGEALDRQRAIPALHVAQSFGALRAELLWQVLFVPMRAPLVGTDWAPIRVEGAGVDDVAELDAGAHEGLAGGSLGARVRLAASGGLELGLTWLWRVDPVPTAADEVVGYGRQHRAAVDVRFATGLVRWRLELAGIDSQSGWTTDRDNVVAPALEAVVSAAAAPAIMLDLELGLRLVHVFVDDDARWLGRGPDDVEAFARVGLLLAYDGVVRLDLEARAGLARDDHDVMAALVVRASPDDEVALGVTVFGGNAVAGGRGALYDADDAVWFRWIHLL